MPAPMRIQKTSGVASAPTIRWRWRMKRTSSRWQRDSAGRIAPGAVSGTRRAVCGISCVWDIERFSLSLGVLDAAAVALGLRLADGLAGEKLIERFLDVVHFAGGLVALRV